MRLLNAKSRKLEYFQGVETPPYVILSHTWDKDEVSFQDIVGLGNRFFLKGYGKINGCCERAVSDGYEYVWMDTCCIDKTSSAELSEAINSMFQWYQDADVCYAYLSDVINNTQKSVLDLQFASSRWFTRGWTLQELIAPSEVVFYDSNWHEIGTKNSLRGTLSAVTGIDTRLFIDGSCDDYSIAQRMSWASKRQTTRPEDKAYCLMGIFGVNMPLLYGEGEKSFLRLQEEIIKRSDDHSLFAWSGESNKWTGLLATSPREFSGSGNIERLSGENISLPYSFNNIGVQITLPLVRSDPYIGVESPWTKSASKRFSAFESRTAKGHSQPVPIDIEPNMEVALLNCQMSDIPGQPIGIVLKRFDNKGLYLRTHHHVYLTSPWHFSEWGKTEASSILVGYSDKLYRSLGESKPLSMDQWCCEIKQPCISNGFFITEQYPRKVWKWSGSGLRLTLSENDGPAALLFACTRRGYQFAVLLQRRNRKVYADVVWCSGKEKAEVILSRCKENLKPQDRIICKLSQGEVVSVKIRRSPIAHLVDISIESDPVSTEPQVKTS